MAYKSRVTNQYMGAGFAGQVASSNKSDMTDLINVLQKEVNPALGKIAGTYIDTQKTEAKDKINSLLATKDSASVQQEILDGKHPDLEGAFVEKTVAYHMGRQQAVDTITDIEKNKNTYDHTKTNLPAFYKQYLPDFSSKDASFTAGFAATFNNFKAKDAIQDADVRNKYAGEQKILGIAKTLSTAETPEEFFGLVDTYTKTKLPNGTYASNEEGIQGSLTRLSEIYNTATKPEEIDFALSVLTHDRGMAKDGTLKGALTDTKRKDVYELVNKLNSKRVTLVNQERINAANKLTTDTDALFKEAADTEIRDQDGGVTTRTHAETVNLINKMKAINPTKTDDLVKFLDSNRYTNNDPAVWNRIKSSITENRYENTNDLDKDMLRNNISSKQWAEARTLQTAAEKAKSAGLLPVYNTDYSYKTGLEDIVKLVKGNYNVGVLGGQEKPNAQAAIVQATDWAKNEILNFEAAQKAKGVAPTFAEKIAHLKLMKDMTREIFTPDTLAGNIPSVTAYESAQQDKMVKQKAKADKYDAAGVNTFQSNVQNVVDNNIDLIRKSIDDAIATFDPSFAGIPFTGGDSSFFSQDSTDKIRVANERLPKYLANAFKDSGFNSEIMATLTDGDYQRFLTQTVDSINKNLKKGGATGLPQIDIKQLDQALQLTLTANK